MYKVTPYFAMASWKKGREQGEEEEKSKKTW